MSWTDERVELLKKMWGEGQSASQIAKELGGVTRNAVIGKVHRLGLSNRTTGATAKPTGPAAAAPAAKEARGKPAAALGQRDQPRGPGQGQRDRETRQAPQPDGPDRAGLQMAHRRPRDG